MSSFTINFDSPKIFFWFSETGDVETNRNISIDPVPYKFTIASNYDGGSAEGSYTEPFDPSAPGVKIRSSTPDLGEMKSTVLTNPFSSKDEKVENKKLPIKR